MNSENTFVEVFSCKIWEAEILKGFLESAGIQVFFKNDIVGLIYPVVSPGGVDPVKVMVSNSDLAIAEKIVEEYQKGENQIDTI